MNGAKNDYWPNVFATLKAMKLAERSLLRV